MRSVTPCTIGLTGGIAMGKTLVSQHLADRYRLPILDADIYARAAVAVGSPVLERIAERYDDILQADGSLNRPKLGDIVFHQPGERQWLEQQIHPFVRQQMEQDRAQHQQAHPEIPVVWVVPLLFEAKLTDFVDEIWVIYCPREHQLQRLMQRDLLTLEQAEARVSSQMPIEQKQALADIVLNNSSTPDALRAQVDHAIAGKI